MDLPEYINKEIWADWLEMRQEKKWPTTGRVQRAALRTLSRALDEGHDPNAMLDNAIQSEWQGLFTGDNTVRKTRITRETAAPRLTVVGDKKTAQAGLAAAKEAL